MDTELYCYAKFARGTGFGNRLFPWARARIFSHLHNVPMLAPAWIQPRIRQFFRGGIDSTAYHRQLLLVGLFRKGEYIRGLPRFLLLCNARRIHEPPKVTSLADQSGAGPVVVVFEGDRNHFADLRGCRDQVLDYLRHETKAAWVALAHKMARPIVINVRCGNDFKTARMSSDYYTKGGIKTPIEWFVASLTTIREIAGYNVPAVVVSDGTSDALARLLNLPAVSFARPGCAISDLLTLAKAKVLIGSGGSSFSAWGAFLSGAPAITHPGQSLRWFKLGDEDQYIGEFDPTRGPDRWFVEQVTARLEVTAV